jgi:lipopolysaccharide/colanic/teichoic acid biosynthesis glycosyltransferase
MRTAANNKLGFVVVAADAACAAFALLIAASLRGSLPRDGLIRLLREGIILLSGTMLLWVGISHRLGFNRVSCRPGDLVSRGIVGSTILSGAVAALAFFARVSFPRLVIVNFLLAFFILTLVPRLLLRAIIYKKRTSPGVKRAVVIGTGRVARELVMKIEEDPTLMCQVVGCLAPESDEHDVPMCGALARDSMSTVGIAKYLANKNIEQVFIVLPNNGDSEVQKLVAECRNAGIEVAFVPHAYELYVSRAVTQDVGGIPLIWIERRTTAPHFLFIQTLSEYVTALAILLVTAPLLVTTAIVLRATRGQAIRRELRCGEAGRRFWMYRFSVDRYRADLNVFEELVVRTSLSELPQLFNVLRGEMSLVGPRPESPDRVNHYSEWEKQRLLYKPGMTGLAQVRGLREQHSSDEKALYDLQYPLSWSPLLDLTLIVQTAITLIHRGIAGDRTAQASHRPSPLVPRAGEIPHVDRPQPSTN